jgi:HlyD family secretion protein
MDRKIDHKWHEKRRVWWWAGSAALVVALFYLVLIVDTQSRLIVDRDRIMNSTNKQGSFQVYIPFTGAVRSIRTVCPNVMEGGRGEAVVCEACSYVDRGDPLRRVL